MDKVTTATYIFVPVILNVEFIGLLIPSNGLSPPTASLDPLLVNAQFSDQVKVKDTSQLINGTSKVLRKLLKYFNGAVISTFLLHYCFLIFCNAFSIIKKFGIFTGIIYVIVCTTYTTIWFISITIA